MAVKLNPLATGRTTDPAAGGSAVDAATVADGADVLVEPPVQRCIGGGAFAAYNGKVVEASTTARETARGQR